MKKNTKVGNNIRPFVVRLGFRGLIEKLEESTKNGFAIQSEHILKILSQLKHRDLLIKGFKEEDPIDAYKEEINLLLSILFPAPLLTNEIKIAVNPSSEGVLMSTTRFKNIFGDVKKLEAKEFDSDEEDMSYIYMCSFILAAYYGKPIFSNIPPVYDVKDERGVTKYYKSGFNAEFVKLAPLQEAPEISKALYQKLKNNTEDIDLWKSIFPPNSWEVSGFGIKTFTDVSNDHALSLIKDNLIGRKVQTDYAEFKSKMNDNISTLLDVPNIKVSFIMYDESKSEFFSANANDESYAFELDQAYKKEDLLCEKGLNQIFNVREDFIVNDIDALPEQTFEISIYRALKNKGVKSYIMTPLYSEDLLLGVLEYSSTINGSLDKTHSYRIDSMKELSTRTVKQFLEEKDDQISSIIQHEFTSIHSSVEWKFREEADKAMQARMEGKQHNFDNIKFQNLTALFGQMDISGSSTARNKGIASDLRSQLKLVRKIIDRISNTVKMPLLDSIKYQSSIMNEKLNSDLAAGMEQELTDFFHSKINPLFKQMSLRSAKLDKIIADYFNKLNPETGVIYKKRKEYDETVKLINMHLSGRLDEKQVNAQAIFPHFFERYKTDGVEHNMFIGQELCPHETFNKLYLDNLRLWQFKTICELEIEHNESIPTLPVPLKVASLIMVYSSSIAIRYRMDEKQFDIDGAYNARYEIIKKRIDKAHIKGTKERITQPGKIVIIYTQANDLAEYLSYTNFLTYEGFLRGEPETFDIEDLQGVVGLKGLRVSVNYQKSEIEELENQKQIEGENFPQVTFAYDDETKIKVLSE